MSNIFRIVDQIFEVYVFNVFAISYFTCCLQTAFQLDFVGVLKTTVLRSSLAVVLFVKDRKAHQRHAMRRRAYEQHSAKR